MRFQLSALIVATLQVMSFGGEQAAANSIPVGNAGFENPPLGDGGFTGSIPSWVVGDGVADAGVFNPNSEYPGGIPEGQNVAFSKDPTISQILGASLQANSLYKLQVDIGHRNNESTLPHYAVELYAGGTLLASESSLAPEPGTFLTSVVSYFASSSDPMVGQALEIRLQVTPLLPNQVNFDNVRLDATVPALANPFVINEVVGDPQQDWNHSSGGVPFDDTPGIGVVTTSDEYIELKNISLITQSLQGYRLLMADGSDATDCFGFAGGGCTTAATYRVTPSGSMLAVPPGGYVVIGNPSGDILNNVSMTLSDSTGAVVDFVNFGGDAPDLNSNSIADEAVSRTPDGVDSDAGAIDFSHGTASLGSANPGGDYNHDGTVDAADYVVWRKSDGTQAGYDTWRAHFGQPPGAGAGAGANTAIPEPATLILMSLAAVGWCLRRERAS